MKTGLAIGLALIAILLFGLVVQHASTENLEYRLSALQRSHSQVDRLQREIYDLADRERHDRSVIHMLEEDLGERAAAYCHAFPQGKNCKEVLASETAAEPDAVK
ncbi:MAG: hypothetical protein ACLQGV_12710 [Bryobacteraceae bacterium]